MRIHKIITDIWPNHSDKTKGWAFLFLILVSFIFTDSLIAQAATYYISKSLGSDSYTSTQAQSKSTPWAHLPGMPSATGNASAHTPSAGDSFILYGGDTWTASDLGINWTNYTGSAANCVLPYGSGATSSCIYVGVDKTWYKSSTCGSSWCRPIFNAGGGLNQPQQHRRLHGVVVGLQLRGVAKHRTDGSSLQGGWRLLRDQRHLHRNLIHVHTRLDQRHWREQQLRLCH